MNPKPASRNPWPIAIIAFFAVFIAFIVTYIVFATRQPEDLVRTDYYDDEIRYQDQIDRVDRTRAVRAQASIAYDAARRDVEIKLPPTHVAQQATGEICLYRPSDSRLDREIKLDLAPNGAQRLDASKLQPGLWKVRLYWKVNGSDYYLDQSIVVENPS